ncbi:MAG: hypothetical protein ABFC94_00060 [Syntrophomonas sp.]
MRSMLKMRSKAVETRPKDCKRKHAGCNRMDVINFCCERLKDIYEEVFQIKQNPLTQKNLGWLAKK